MAAKITLKNYRCFRDESPASLMLDRDIVSLVGPNNSGKSSFLKFFVEFRPQFSALRDPKNLWDFIAHPKKGRGGQAFIDDQTEIFCDQNDRDLTIEVEVDPLNDSSAYLQKARFTLDRDTLGQWQTEFFLKGDKQPIHVHYSGSLGRLDNQFLLSTSAQKIADCAALMDAFERLGRVFYIGPFRNAINIGQGDYYDLHIGTKFIDTWEEWQTGADKSKQRAITSAVEDIRHLFGYSQLSITAAKRLQTLQLSIDSKPYKLREVGAGLQQFIIVFGNAVIHRPNLILIDEPEANLHPALQVDFLTSLASYSSNGLVFATHSIGLARSCADKIFSTRRVDGVVKVTPFERTVGLTQFLGEMSFSSYQEIGTTGILLVEGTTDIRTFQQLLRKYRKDHEFVVIQLGGDSLAKGNSELEILELRRLTTRLYAVVDSERTDKDKPPKKERIEFAKFCKNTGIDALITQRRAIENYFSDQAVRRVKGDKYRALRPYESLKDMPLAWSKQDNWRIAREIPREELDQTDLGKFLSRI